MDDARCEYLSRVASELCSHIRTIDGFAPHPTYLDEGVMDFLDDIIVPEATRVPVDVAEMVAELRDGNFERAFIEVPDALISIAIERDAALDEVGRMTALMEAGDAELQARLLKVEAERDACVEVVQVANKVCTILAQHGIVTRETRLDGVELYGWLRQALAAFDEEEEKRDDREIHRLRRRHGSDRVE